VPVERYKAANPKAKVFSDKFLIVTPGITIRDRLRVLYPNDPDNYYRAMDLVTADQLERLQAATILLDEVPEVDVMWTTITASDVPVEVRELVVCYVVLTETRKHVTLVDSPSQAEPLLHIMDIVSGDAEAFRARPRFSTLLTAASPLRIDGPLLDFHAVTAGRGAPVEVYTVPMAGATSRGPCSNSTGYAMPCIRPPTGCS
jgi:trimethylamine:corrinoid methyltransferase-like protein